MKQTKTNTRKLMIKSTKKMNNDDYNRIEFEQLIAIIIKIYNNNNNIININLNYYHLSY